MLARFIQRRIEKLPAESAARRSAEQWVIECSRCGHAVPALERGVLRVYAAPKEKRMLARCTSCGSLTLAKLYSDEAKANDLRINELESELGSD